MKAKYGRLLLVPLFVMLVIAATAQVTVNTLQELKPYLKQDGVNVKLAPGVYNITKADVDKGLFTSETTIVGRTASVLLLFEGNNSTYDFTGVTINVETAVFRAYGGNQVYEVQIIGNDNVLKNLTLVDVGSVHDGPVRGALNICMDGARNRVEGFHVTAKGSFPYGYGDAFGKGGGPVIPHQKHSACLIRGESNHLLNSSFIHQTYGHCIFMQAANNPKIEGCYVEGEVRTTDDMLLEQGTGSPADKVGFTTTWGYKLPAGYMMSTGEGGIRAYNAGETVIDGVEYERGTSNPTILNCTVFRMRAGVTLTHATGTKRVEGCSMIECERGYAIGSGDIIDCITDTKYGPALGVDYVRDRGVNADITLINSGSSYNGSKHAAIIIGSNHNITLRGQYDHADQELKVNVGGDNNTIGLRAEEDHFTAENITINNLTGYPLVLSDESTNISGESCGPLTDLGSGNNITTSDCQLSVDSILVEAENFTSSSGVESVTTTDESGGQQVAMTTNGDWVEYQVHVPAAGEYVVHSRVASAAGGAMQYKVDGVMASHVSIAATGGDDNWITNTASLFLTAGMRTIRVQAASGGWHFNWFMLEKATSDHVFVSWVSLIPQYNEIDEEGSLQLTYTVYPTNATNQEVIYESENPAIATVDENGLVTGVSHGVTYILVKTLDGAHVDRAKITVNRLVGRNLALEGTATQSSTAYNGPAHLAIDGNTDGNYGNGSVSHTGHNDPVKWWQVDLGGEYVIDEIIIHNRTGSTSYSSRLSDITVEIINAAMDTLFTQFYPGYPNPSLTIPIDDLLGQYVRIWKTSDNGMTLAEVEVFGFDKPKTAQQITFPELPEKQVGDADFDPGASASSGLGITYTSSDEQVASIVSGKVHIVGAGVATITASQAGDETYAAAADVSQVLTVKDQARQDQTITFEQLATIRYGDSDVELVASASSGLAVTFTSSDETVAKITDGKLQVQRVGSATITALQDGNDMYNPATATQTIQVEKAVQSIQFEAFESKKYGDPEFAPQATSSAGLELTYSSSNSAVAQIQNGMVTIVGVGTTAITASQEGNENYTSAKASQNLTVSKADQTITFGPIPEKGVGDEDFWPGAVASSGLPVAYSSSDETVATIVEGNVRIQGKGSAQITAIQAGNEYYNSAEASQTLVVGAATQEITFDALPILAVGDADFSPQATATSGLEVLFKSSDETVAQIVANKIRAVGVGICSITAYQPGDASYAAAAEVSQNLAVIPSTVLNAVTEQTLSVYPNPVTDQLFAAIPEANFKQYVLYGVNGQVIKAGALQDHQSTLQLDMSEVEKGLYMLRLSNANQSITTRFIKQ
ncbi:carbohydrate-binding protein [Marinoscillum furvescens]|uniref:Putative secreted protein (Por secretion system target) n=1 Tax=Marinoscillum furvescens DSM 4134 TaxID=1122208 RepID=A0A3D9L1Z3_MARFU|nr:carbohydrate-binding protein [Marinoscillum furvescens]RED98372.1 putative secreted protein (Por secretion system target) [Marinoscillum furvescens DSM 4134]